MTTGPSLSPAIASAEPAAAGWRPALVLGAIAVLALALRLACFTGLIGSDDLRYALYANALAEGHYSETLADARAHERIHHGLRYGVIIPVAGIYTLLGVSEWTTILLPLAASTLSVLLLAAIARRLFDARVAVVASLLYATFPMQLRLATTLLPEPIAECFVLLGVLAFVYARERGGWYWLVAGACAGVAYLAKEPALFAGLALGLHALWERRWRGAALLALGVAGVMAAEHAYYVVVQGDIMFRAHSTQLHSLDLVHPPPLLERVANSLSRFDYPQTMIVPGVEFGLHSLVALVLSAAALASRPRKGLGLLVLLAAVPWLYLSFGSWSLQQYVPVPREPRYIMLVYPPLLLLAAVALVRATSRRPALVRPAAVLVGVVMAVGVASGLATRGRTARAEEMSVLREIVRAARETPDQSIYTEDPRWQRALAVFDASIVSDSPDGATVILVRGPLDLPMIRRGSGVAHGPGPASEDAP